MKKGRKGGGVEGGEGKWRQSSRRGKDEAEQQKRGLRRRERGRAGKEGGTEERKIERDHVTRLI